MIIGGCGKPRTTLGSLVPVPHPVASPAQTNRRKIALAEIGYTAEDAMATDLAFQQEHRSRPMTRRGAID